MAYRAVPVFPLGAGEEWRSYAHHRMRRQILCVLIVGLHVRGQRSIVALSNLATTRSQRCAGAAHLLVHPALAATLGAHIDAT